MMPSSVSTESCPLIQKKSKESKISVNNSVSEIELSAKKGLEPKKSSARGGSKKDNAQQRTMVSNDRHEALISRTKYFALKQKLRLNVAQHGLAATHLSALYFVKHTVPRTTVLATIWLLSFFSGSDFLSKHTEWIFLFNCVSIKCLFLCQVLCQCDYNKRAEMHRDTAFDLEELSYEAENPYYYYRYSHPILTVAEYSSIQRRYLQCLKGCKATLPWDVAYPFQRLDSEIDSLLTVAVREKLHRSTGREYCEEYDYIFRYFCTDLKSEFEKHWSWPLCLPRRPLVGARRTFKARWFWKERVGGDESTDTFDTSASIV